MLLLICYSAMFIISLDAASYALRCRAIIDYRRLIVSFSFSRVSRQMRYCCCYASMLATLSVAEQLLASCC